MADDVFPVLGYRLVSGSSFDRGVLLRCLQATHQELRQLQLPEPVQPPSSDSHLINMVEQYLSPDTPLWWVEVNTPDSQPSFSPLFRSIQHPVGCLWLARSIDQISGDRQTQILLLYVHPQHRRKGMGSALMQWAFNWAALKGDRQVSLQVFDWNKPALKLYQKMGFSSQFLGMTKTLSQSKPTE
jgi:GNAT superfamily N-acetyltransferase